MSIADRIAIFEHGRVRQVGTPGDVYNKPNCRYVAELVGSPPMNFVDGRLAGANFEADEISFSLGFDGLSGSRSASLAIRPEDIEIHAGTNGAGNVDANVYEVEPLGAFTIVDVNIGEKILKVQAAGLPDYELGQPVRLGIEAAKCHLFDESTGEAIRNAV